jgi:putative heme-binding domain-containing protein
MLRPSILPALFAWLVIPLSAQHGGTTATNVYRTRADRLAGGKLFQGHCAACHGPDGSGGSAGPSLITGSFRHGSSDDAVFQSIAKGIPGTAMPAFALDGRQIWQLVAYVRSLSIGKGAAQAKGDVKAGALVFQRNGCAACHAIGGQGALIGPDLTEAGATRSLGDLRASVLKPDETVSPEFWSVRAKSKDGQTLTGIRLNEDSHSIQMRDAAGRLVSISKSDVSEYQMIRRSPMPSFDGKLSGKDLEDLLAFLANQRTDSK